uniref:(California timema) hypothetical protein n=1 Tax=Timema californicum TaxID=61474 RepID=A0A7R9JDT7_TIMCA|nr:unnamed protein product [Timema californicum]
MMDKVASSLPLESGFSPSTKENKAQEELVLMSPNSVNKIAGPSKRAKILSDKELNDLLHDNELSDISESECSSDSETNVEISSGSDNDSEEDVIGEDVKVGAKACPEMPLQTSTLCNILTTEESSLKNKPSFADKNRPVMANGRVNAFALMMKHSSESKNFSNRGKYCFQT